MTDFVTNNQYLVNLSTAIKPDYTLVIADNVDAVLEAIPQAKSINRTIVRNGRLATCVTNIEPMYQWHVDNCRANNRVVVL